jgi:hypothetical protein
MVVGRESTGSTPSGRYGALICCCGKLLCASHMWGCGFRKRLLVAFMGSVAARCVLSPAPAAATAGTSQLP